MQFLKNTKYKKKRTKKIKNTKYKKKRTQNFKNTKYKKKRTQNFKNTKYKKNANFKMSQRANPMFILKSKNQLAK